MPRDRYDDEDEDVRPRRRRRDDDEDDDRPRRRRRDDDDDDDRPRRSRRLRDDDRRSAPQGNGMAVASLVLGILSICFGPITGIIGGILGIMGLNKTSGKGMAIAGMGTSGLFSVVWVVLAVWGFLWAKDSQGRVQDSRSLKQIGLAAHNYHDANGELPPPFVRRPNEFPGQPVSDLNDRLSWRVYLLPYIEHDSTYRQFKLNEPWNSATNMPLGNTAIRAYSDTDALSDPNTRFRCFYDNGAMFDTRGWVTLSGVTDGTSNTIMYVEGGDKVTWSRFQEYKFDPKGSLPSLGRADKDGFNVVMGDGYARWVKKSVDPNILKAMITRNGGEVVTLDK
jgi:hypothetical protein